MLLFQKKKLGTVEVSVISVTCVHIVYILYNEADVANHRSMKVMV